MRAFVRFRIGGTVAGKSRSGNRGVIERESGIYHVIGVQSWSCGTAAFCVVSGAGNWLGA